MFKRTKTCTDPPFVYAGPVEPCKFLNDKQCNRICTVPCKRIAKIKNAFAQTLPRPVRVNGVLARKKHSQFWGLQRYLKDFNKPETTSEKGTVHRTFTASLFFLMQNRRNKGIGVRRGYAKNSCTALTLAWGRAFTLIAMDSLRHLG